jgi:hypothetical protein
VIRTGRLLRHLVLFWVCDQPHWVGDSCP